MVRRVPQGFIWYIRQIEGLYKKSDRILRKTIIFMLRITRNRGVICNPLRVVGKMMGSVLDCVIAKDQLLLCQMHYINSMSRGNILAPNRRNSLPSTVKVGSLLL